MFPVLALLLPMTSYAAETATTSVATESNVNFSDPENLRGRLSQN